MLDDAIREEEAKRDRNGDAQQRWNAIQQMIAWAEAQATVRRNTPEACQRAQEQYRCFSMNR